MKHLLSLVLCLLSLPSFAQSVAPPTPLLLGIGYGYVQDGGGWLEPSGQLLYLSGQRPLGQSKWLEISGRLVGTLIEEQTPIGHGFTAYQQSNGGNLEVDLSAHLRNSWIDCYASAGPAVRYVSAQYMRYYSIRAGGSVAVLEEIRYETYRGVQAGYTLGLNVDLKPTRALSVGGRAAVSQFLKGSTYAMLNLTVKYRGWQF